MSFEGIYEVGIFDCPTFRCFTAGDSHRAKQILVNKSFEPGSMALWCKPVRKAKWIADVGAQEGIYALAAATLRPDIPIHAFEPNPYAYARLRVHKALNRFENIVEHCCALADREAVTALHVVPKGLMISSGGSIVASPEGRETIVTPVARFDSCGITGPGGLMKIDVEGAETLVFRGMAGVVSSRPDIILETFSANACDEVWAMLAPLGYRAFKIIEGDGKLIPQERLTPCDVKGEDYNQFLTCGPGYENR